MVFAIEICSHRTIKVKLIKYNGHNDQIDHLDIHFRCNDANDEGEKKEIDVDIEEDPPQYSDYQHNFIESGGLKVIHYIRGKQFHVNHFLHFLQISSQSVSELNFYNFSQNASVLNRISEKSTAINNRVQYVLIATILFLCSYVN